jgi:hypothetical protein
METEDGKNLDRVKSPLCVIDGDRAGERRTHADVELDRAQRALFVAMCGRDGKSINKNFRNVACGATKPWRMLVRRLREAKGARNDRVNYPLAKLSVAQLDAWVDDLYRKSRNGAITTTGDHPRAA